ncbi:MAG: UDP-2,3-diacylglucosamine diphosphatase [Smithella sp.]
MKAIFISDVHLKNANDDRYKILINFFENIRDGKVKSFLDKSNKQKIFIDDLYIVGDLFDFWLCNKNKIYPQFSLIINKLIELQKAGIHIHLSEGNHDFFLHEYFHEVLGMEVYEEWADVQMDNIRALIGHGDTMDNTNFKYLFLRKILRSRFFYHFQRFIPAQIRWTLANFSSMASKEMTIESGKEIVEKMLSFALNKFNDGYDAVIVGHCHKPVLRHYTSAGKKKTFIALGDWIDHYSFLYYENKKFHMGYYRAS